MFLRWDIKIFFITLLIISTAQAFDKADFLRRVERNEVSFDRGATMNLEGEVLERVSRMNHAKYPNFKPSMMYYHSVVIDKVVHMIFYDYTASECVYLYIDMKKSVEENKKMFTAGSNGAVNNSQKDIIPIKICEKLYNFYLKK